VDLPSLTGARVPASPVQPEEQTLKADPFAQLRLLDVQTLDSRADQLRHLLVHLPEDAELRDLEAQRRELDGRARDLQVRVDDLEREQRKADADVEQVKARRRRDQERMDAGAVANPKDLQRMQHELVSLDRRISDLEDVELEVMEQLEQAQADLAQTRTVLADSEKRADSLAAARAERSSATEEALAAATSERAAVAAGLPAELLALYERVRTQRAGVGAAALRARRCQGCSLELNAAELGAIRAASPDEVVRCEECGRILVRTAESGL
jgi:predicted  nucleic acid-binding Zn-ribbon protein